MKIHLLTAEHFSVPGIITKAFTDLPAAEAEAMELTNLMLSDNGQAKSANASNWRAKVEALQDQHGRPSWAYSTSYGWFVWAGSDETDDDDDDLPAEVVACRQRARSLCCDYLLFDADAETVEGLEVFAD